nr:retrotransposon protein, putative, Ty1-copia subclass [Tanacetum cinerariifolium]
MDKLQRDGILQFTHNESLEKCKYCITGKMARKPFPHQVERAKELLGLIDTDVCVPFRTVSREGASYFITFIYDFSHYGYVYLMKHKHENKIFVARNAEFFENSLIVKEASGSHEILKMSRSDEGLELIYEEDTQPSKNTSEEHNEVVPIEVEPQNVKVPIRRSVRIPQAPDRYGFYVDVDEYELGDLNEPPNYKAALSDPEYDKWLEAMNTEMQSIKDNRLIALSQSAYLEKILKKFRMENSKKGYTLMMEKPDYRKSQGAKTPSEVQHMQRDPYASAIRSIMYAIHHTCLFSLPKRLKVDSTIRVNQIVTIFLIESSIHLLDHYRYQVDTSLIHVEYGKSPTAELFDDDSEGFSFINVNTKEYHSECSGNYHKDNA